LEAIEGAANFKNVQPGVTTLDQLKKSWGHGTALSRTDDQTALRFAVESFPHVEVTLADNKVRTIDIMLDSPLTAAETIQKLQLQNVRPVKIPDDSGEVLGLAFPERGVL